MAAAPKRIMVVDDNPAVASVIRFNLERLGYRVTVTRDGEEAWRQLQRQPHDLVITDHQMPRMTGGQLCHKLRSTPEYAETPLILLTAKAMEVDVQELQQQCRLASVFVKPFSPGEMVRAVEAALNPGPQNGERGTSLP